MKPELKKRIITGLIFGILVISALIFSKYSAVFLFVLFGILSSVELLRMAQPEKPLKSQWGPLVLVLALYLLAIQIDLKGGMFRFLLFVSTMVCVYLSLSLFNGSTSKYQRFSAYYILFYPALSFCFPVAHLWKDFPTASTLVLGIIIIIWVSDSSAYFVGSRFGKTKVLPKISPKKTWEGVYGGIFFSIATGVVLAFYTNTYSLVFWVILSILVCITGIVGDFCESACKRYFNVKDSGKLLPGHGGFLDRFDSLIFAFPFSYLLLILFKFI